MTPAVPRAPRAPRRELNNILDALDRLLKMFIVERYVYLALTAISFAILLYSGFQLITKENKDLFGIIFGASGLISIAATRITWFFNKAFSLVEKVAEGNKNERQ